MAYGRLLITDNGSGAEVEGFLDGFATAPRFLESNSILALGLSERPSITPTIVLSLEGYSNFTHSFPKFILPKQYQIL